MQNEINDPAEVGPELNLAYRLHLDDIPAGQVQEYFFQGLVGKHSQAGHRCRRRNGVVVVGIRQSNGPLQRRPSVGMVTMNTERNDEGYIDCLHNAVLILTIPDNAGLIIWSVTGQLAQIVIILLGTRGSSL